MADIRFSSENFASTTVTVEPVSMAGRVLFRQFFGEACSSVTLRKSGGIELHDAITARGLVVTSVPAADDDIPDCMVEHYECPDCGGTGEVEIKNGIDPPEWVDCRGCQTPPHIASPEHVDSDAL